MSQRHANFVLLTLAPDLAHLEYLDAGPVILPQPRSQQLQHRITIVQGQAPSNTPPCAAASVQTGAASGLDTPVEVESSADDPSDSEPSHEFYLNVQLERTEATFTNCGPGKPKNVIESKPGLQLPLLELSCQAVIEHILKVHSLQERYFPGPISGPPFKANTYKCLSGGACGAPTICQDDDWSNLKGQLAKTKAAVDSVQVILAFKDLELYKNHKRLLSSDPVKEAVQGTYVPSVHGYSNTQRELAAKIGEIKTAWPCLKHGLCFIDADSQHIMLTRYRLNSWASALLTDHFKAKDQYLVVPHRVL
ncbi:hypothetical protein NLJ89_g11963 [Agrocybe chaxingu]|uniref:Uncharacterized protein n=1 Tax=Agrocybe chaxingu TaxID=84603 RepID=A0A9W8JVS1_9AGAR|nr:hypothetical protein NLJ89_g11963 [Agrocybe chaxingu]